VWNQLSLRWDDRNQHDQQMSMKAEPVCWPQIRQKRLQQCQQARASVNSR
jgi:hypothetical protein